MFTRQRPIPPFDLGAVLRQFGIRPNRGRGQNFLADDNLLGKITAAADLTLADSVLEVGPGVGSLTRRLAWEAGRVVAVEVDGRLIPALEQVLAPFENVRVVQGDILALDPAELMGGDGYKVVANIPYNITSALLRHLLEAAARPALLALTVQQEVAERICAGPGQMSLLAVSVQYYGQPRIVAHIPAGAFFPRPEVDSAVVRVDLYDCPAVGGISTGAFFRAVKAGFSQRRKQLRNSLSAGLGLSPAGAAAALEVAGVDPRRRAETLSLEEWGRVANGLQEV
ncbi:MAG: ribosomal RNA small subunit methyltransferase A [Chloroflexi bacterium]|nr:ribosomal RNA small subunit methyltransferase A [Chloroflexota bacterium]